MDSSCPAASESCDSPQRVSKTARREDCTPSLEPKRARYLVEAIAQSLEISRTPCTAPTLFSTTSACPPPRRTLTFFNDEEPVLSTPATPASARFCSNKRGTFAPQRRLHVASATGARYHCLDAALWGDDDASSGESTTRGSP